MTNAEAAQQAWWKGPLVAAVIAAATGAGGYWAREVINLRNDQTRDDVRITNLEVAQGRIEKAIHDDVDALRTDLHEMRNDLHDRGSRR